MTKNYIEKTAIFFLRKLISSDIMSNYLFTFNRKVVLYRPTKRYLYHLYRTKWYLSQNVGSHTANEVDITQNYTCYSKHDKHDKQ